MSRLIKPHDWPTDIVEVSSQDDVYQAIKDRSVVVSEATVQNVVPAEMLARVVPFGLVSRLGPTKYVLNLHDVSVDALLGQDDDLVQDYLARRTADAASFHILASLGGVREEPSAQLYVVAHSTPALVGTKNTIIPTTIGWRRLAMQK